MPLINYEINLILTWFDKCVLSNQTEALRFAITDTKILCSSYLSIADNTKLLPQLKSAFKRTTN